MADTSREGFRPLYLRRLPSRLRNSLDTVRMLLAVVQQTATGLITPEELAAFLPGGTTFAPRNRSGQWPKSEAFRSIVATYLERLPSGFRNRIFAGRVLSTVLLQMATGRISLQELAPLLSRVGTGARREMVATGLLTPGEDVGTGARREMFRRGANGLAIGSGDCALGRYVGYARRAMGNATDLAADVYVAHGVQALPAAWHVRQKHPGLVYCDAIEIPSFGARAIKSRWDDVALGFVDGALESYLRKADGILTVGWELGKHLEEFGRPVHVIPNYRYREAFNPSQILRGRCGLSMNDRIVLAMNLVTSGFDVVLHACKNLPDNFHLVVLGQFSPEAFGAEMKRLVGKLGLASRVHFLEPVAYEKLTAVASGADVGLIVLDPKIPNHFVSLPNRIFDYAASSLPVVTPEIPDIARLVREYDFGYAVDAANPVEWSDAILRCLARQSELRANALKAASALTWDALEAQLVESLYRPKSVTFFGVGDLTKNNRTLRMCKSLVEAGASVTICTEKRSTDLTHLPSIQVRLLS